jgi:hypothetical protein
MLAAFALLATAGCKNEVDRAIEKLGGTKQEQEAAMGAIQISASDPMPKLAKALKNPKMSPLAKKNVALLIGAQAEKSNDDSVVPALVDAMKGADKGIQLAILDALDKIPGEKSLDALREALKSGVKEVSEEAGRLLDDKAYAKIKQADALLGDEAVKRQIELVKEAVEINPSNREFKDRLAGLYTIAGQDDKAKAIYSEGGEFATAFKVIGPFPGGDQDYVNPAAPDFTKPVAGPDGAQFQWADFSDVPASGTADFRKNREMRKPNSVVYAAFKATAGKEQKALLKFTSGDKFRIWLNGAELQAGAGKGDEYRIEVTLKSGENQVLIRDASRRFARFSARFSGADDKKIDGLKYGL